MGEDKAFYQRVAMTKEELTSFLASPHLGRISTVEGAKPHTTPVWYLYDGVNFFVSTGMNTRTARNIEKNPYISLVIDESEGMFRHRCVIVEGRAQLNRELHPEITREIYTRYLGKKGLDHQFAKDLLESDQFVLKITPSKILSWDYTKAIQS